MLRSGLFSVVLAVESRMLASRNEMNFCSLQSRRVFSRREPSSERRGWFCMGRREAAGREL